MVSLVKIDPQTQLTPRVNNYIARKSGVWGTGAFKEKIVHYSKNFTDPGSLELHYEIGDTSFNGCRFCWRPSETKFLERKLFFFV